MRPLPLLLLAACGPGPYTGPPAEGIHGELGAPLPGLTDEEAATFARGHDVAIRRFTPSQGLGPAFNVTFCAACHEKPVTGGAAGTYRNFFLAGSTTPEGDFFLGEADGFGVVSGVVRLYYDGTEDSRRPAVPDDLDVVAQRNAIPFFGVGLLAEVDEDAILALEDPDDRDGDGISGRANYDRGFVGRFGMKSQTVSIEGFIRGPLFNHAGITSDPLTDAQRARLPVDSSGGGEATALRWLGTALGRVAQAAAPDGPLTDDDGVADPELSTDDLFDLVSFAMLTAAPRPDEPTAQTEDGRAAFAEIGCTGCHVPMLYSSARQGGIPAYTDLLLHDMGPELADGIAMKLATGSEFRTQPLWGVGATAPYLHDGRAGTLEEAIAAHGGEASHARDAWHDLSPDRQQALLAFLRSLGGASQASDGLVPPGAPLPPPGALGGPVSPLDAAAEARFLAGRAAFDREHALASGVGGPRFNGDSCRACHFEPVLGGAGPRGVDVIRHALRSPDGRFVAPAVGTVLHRTTRLHGSANLPQRETATFELRQTPHLFGLGLIDALPEAVILAGADPDDLDGDGIAGRPSWTDGGRLGRFGWKAQVPDLHEFVRDAFHVELGLTLPHEPGRTFGFLQDDDDVADPEAPLEEVLLVRDYLAALAPPPRQPAAVPEQAERGEALFGEVGCAACHTPALEGPDGPVPLYSDLLLHTVLPEGTPGIEDASAGERDFRTAPLWGIAVTAPYLHDGRAETLADAIEGHDGEAATARDAVRALPEADRDALLAFLGTL